VDNPYIEEEKGWVKVKDYRSLEDNNWKGKIKGRNATRLWKLTLYRGR
jgi:hypothetical protein